MSAIDLEALGPPPPQGGGTTESVTSRGEDRDHIRTAIQAFQIYAEGNHDDVELAKVHKCIVALPSILADHSKNRDAAMGGTPAMKHVYWVSGSRTYYWTTSVHGARCGPRRRGGCRQAGGVRDERGGEVARLSGVVFWFRRVEKRQPPRPASGAKSKCAAVMSIPSGSTTSPEAVETSNRKSVGFRNAAAGKRTVAVPEAYDQPGCDAVSTHRRDGSFHRRSRAVPPSIWTR